MTTMNKGYFLSDRRRSGRTIAGFPEARFPAAPPIFPTFRRLIFRGLSKESAIRPRLLSGRFRPPTFNPTMSLRHFLLLLPGLALSAETYPAGNGLTRTLVAKEPLLKNPVSVSVDVDGTIYVTETARRKVGDLDIREFTEWIHDDLSHTTVEEKADFFKRALDGKKYQNHVSLKDWNKDGVVDVKDLTVISEKIIKFTDKDGDGVMDASNTFAEGFNTEVTGIAAGVFAWRGDVFTTIAPDVWKLRDTDNDGKADQRESIAHGFGIHIAYAGHDMHGLTWGPDGKLYWSIGDKGTNVMSKEGKRWYAPNEGAVLRCNPDGTGFEIFARGLRNVQEIAFDDYGNLFGVDNDSDQKGERERFVYITPDSDSGWRCYYQYRKSDYNPWMLESMSVPTGPNQPAYITPPLASYGDGPAGFAYNPGTALNERYKGSFFVSEFPKGEVHSFKVEENGAAFKMTDEHTVISGPMNIGLNFGPDGALYSADWAGGYPLKEKGGIWKLDDTSQTGTAIRKEVAAFLKEGPPKVSTPELAARLSHADQRIRLDAQWELARRKATPELKAVAENSASPRIAVIHALWGLSQNKIFDEGTFALLIAGKDAELRAQAAKWAGELSGKPQPALGALLADPSSRVRFFAAHAIGKLGMTEQLDGVIAMLEKNANSDPYLRQAGVLALSGMDMEKVANKVVTHPSAAVRLAAAVAFRRTSSPYAAELLADKDALVVTEAAHSIFDWPGIPAAYSDLGNLIDTNPTASVPAIRRSIAINRTLADGPAAERLIKFAVTKSNPEPLRVAALQALATWNSDMELNLVDGRWEPTKAADTAPAKPAYEKVADQLGHDPSDAIAVAASEAAAAFGISAKAEDLIKEASDTSAKPAARMRSLKLLEKVDPKAFKEIAFSLLKSDSPAFRSSAATLLAKNNPDEIVSYIRDTVTHSKDNGERQQAVDLLLVLRENSAASKFFSELITKSIKEPDGPILLELLEIAEEIESKNEKPLRQKLAKSGELGAYKASYEGGDAALGAKVFSENLAAQCLACHRLGPEGSNVGPPLNEIGKKGRDYIFEALLDPNAKLAPGFGLMTAILKDGKTASGALKGETADTLTIGLPDGTEQKIATKDIASRTPPVSVMPPMGAVLNARELRDVVEYLTTLK